MGWGLQPFEGNFCKYCLDSGSVANDANSTSGRSEPGLSTEGAHKSNSGVEDMQKTDPGESSTRACVKNLLHTMILLLMQSMVIDLVLFIRFENVC